MEITKDILDKTYLEVFRKEDFLAIDPCGIVYELMEHTDSQLDIELGALFVAMITWGNRKAIRTAARHMLQAEMGWRPGTFVMDGLFEQSYANAKNRCVYRTLNSDAFKLVCRNVREALRRHRTMEEALANLTTEECIAEICKWLAPARLGTAGKSACKRICMFLRWMVRDNSHVDLGLWTDIIDKRSLIIPMDTHVVQEAMRLGLITSRSTSMANAMKLSRKLAECFPDDPARGDFALFGVGVDDTKGHGTVQLSS